MIFTQISRPDALDERQYRDDFSVGELVPVAWHVAGRFAIAIGYAKLGDVEKKFVGMMPRVTRLVMRGRFPAAITRGAAPVRLAFEVLSMTGCAVGLVERRTTLHSRLIIRKQPDCARRDRPVARIKHSHEQDQRAENYPYSFQSIIPGVLRQSSGKSKALRGTLYSQWSAP